MFTQLGSIDSLHRSWHCVCKGDITFSVIRSLFARLFWVCSPPLEKRITDSALQLTFKTCCWNNHLQSVSVISPHFSLLRFAKQCLLYFLQFISYIVSQKPNIKSPSGFQNTGEMASRKFCKQFALSAFSTVTRAPCLQWYFCWPFCVLMSLDLWEGGNNIHSNKGRL